MMIHPTWRRIWKTLSFWSDVAPLELRGGDEEWGDRFGSRAPGVIAFDSLYIDLLCVILQVLGLCNS